MRTRTALSVLLVVGSVLAACQNMPRSKNKRPETSGDTVWTIDWSDDGEFESDDVYSSPETADPLAGDVQLKKVTSLGQKAYLLGFDVRPADSKILMSILEGVGERHSSPYANIWTADVHGGLDRKTRVTEGPSLDLTPTYVPKEEAILFSSNRVGSTFSIFKKQLQGGGGVQLITSQNSQDLWPQVDGETGLMLFTQVREASAGGGILWMRPVEGGAPTQVGEGTEARWSADGKMLLYSAENPSTGQKHIWVRSVDGNQPEQVTEGNHNDINPCWSPDGTKIVFASDRATNAEGKHNYDIWLRNTDGKDEPHQLTANESVDDNPRWLDSETILFRSNRGGEWNVWSLKISQMGG